MHFFIDIKRKIIFSYSAMQHVNSTNVEVLPAFASLSVTQRSGTKVFTNLFCAETA